MVTILRVNFCDEVSEAQFGKFNLLGYIPSDQITINEIPYIFQSTLIIEGEIHQSSCEENLSLNLISRSLDGNTLNNGEFILGRLPQVDFENQPMIITVPIRWTIQEYGEIEVTLLIDALQVFKKTFKFVQGNAPNVRLIKRFQSSSLVTSGSVEFDLEVLVRSASKELILIDQFLEPNNFYKLVSLTFPNVQVKALVGQKFKPLYKQEIEEIKLLQNPTEIRFSAAFHDRFIIINETEYFHFGQSLKDLKSGRISRFSKMLRRDEIDELKKKFISEWSKAEYLGV